MARNELNIGDANINNNVVFSIAILHSAMYNTKAI